MKCEQFRIYSKKVIGRRFSPRFAPHITVKVPWQHTKKRARYCLLLYILKTYGLAV